MIGSCQVLVGAFTLAAFIAGYSIASVFAYLNRRGDRGYP